MLAIHDSPHADTAFLRLLLDNFTHSAAALYDDELRVICAGGELLPLLDIGTNIEGRRVAELFPQIQTELITRWFIAALNGQPVSMVWPNADKLFNITVRQVRSETGKLFGVVVVQNWEALTPEQAARLQEGSQQAVVHREAEIAQAKARLIERILHEFRNPLAAAASSAELLETHGGAMSDARRDQHVARINQEIHRLSDILDDILNLFS